MKKMTIVSLMLMVSTQTFASDHWDNCASADGRVVLENGEVVLPEANTEENLQIGKLVKKVLIRTENETCRLQNGKNRVPSLISETSFEIYETRIAESVGTIELLCERGGSGIPANDSCNEATVRKSVKFHVK